jgi:16S rRNA processing protein RimM
MSRAGEPSEDSPGLEVGRVSKAHGITGELRIVPHWESSDALEHVREIWLTLKGERTTYEVERARAVPRAYLVKLRGVNDRNAAEALHGATVSVPRSVLPPLEPGEYYLVDLIGTKVLGPEGEIGEVTGIVSHPTVDVIVVRLSDGKTAEQPLSEPWFSHVDMAARQVILNSLDGLM